MSAASAAFGLIGFLYIVCIIAAVVLLVWIGILLIKFLRLKNAEMRHRLARLAGPDENAS